MIDHKTLETFEILEESGELTNREKHLFEVTKQLRDESAERFIKLAELAHRVGHARSQCRRENEILCPLYEIKLEGGKP